MSQIHMPHPPTQEQPTDEKPESLTREEVQAMVQTAVNGALGTHSKRTEKLIAETLSKALEGFKPKADEAPTKEGKEPTEVKLLQQQLADLKRRYEESETKATKAEESARTQREHSALRVALEAKGVRKEAVDYVISHWATSGALRRNETGDPLVAIRRSRAKDAPPEEMLFDSFEAGVADWIKSPEAAVFIAPPSNVRTSNPNPAGSGPFNPNGRSARRNPLDEILSQAAIELAQTKEP